MRGDSSLDFEYCVRQFLGDKASHIADFSSSEADFRKWLRRCLNVIIKNIDKIDTTTRHKEMLMSEVEGLDELLKIKGGGHNNKVIISLFWLVSRLLGFDYLSGEIINQPIYYQNFDKYFKEKIENGETWKEIRNEKENLLTVRRKVYENLKKDGYSDNQIAQIMNTNEYQIKKIKHNI